MTTTTIPFDRATIQKIIAAQPFDVRQASIREMNRLVKGIEQALDVRFIRMEFGIPGLPTPVIAVQAEIEALRDRKVGHVYAPFDGLPELTQEASRFAKLYMNLDIPPACCVPTVGAMEGCFASLTLANRMHHDRHTLLILQPGFPVNRQQARFLGMKVEGIDFYDHRGDALIEAVEQRLAKGDIAAMLWSSPNNPSWIVLKEPELEGFGRLCDRYDVLAIEDLAYFGMDVRQDYLNPGVPPYQPTVAAMIGFVGLSHLGLVYSLASAARGFEVVAYEPDADRGRELAEGHFPIEEPGLRELFAANQARLHYTHDASRLVECDPVFVSLDLQTDDKNQSDLSPLRSLIDSTWPRLAPGCSMVILSQVRPGFTRGLAGSVSSGATPAASRIFYQVETLVFGAAVERALHPERYIVGSARPDVPLPASYRTWLDAFGCPILVMRYESAELAKVAINLFLVSSVSTTNTLAELCRPSARTGPRSSPRCVWTGGLGPTPT